MLDSWALTQAHSVGATQIRSPNRVRFGVCECDLRAGVLFVPRGRTVLQEQPLQILTMLAQAGGEIVTRDEIKKRLWPNDTIVEFDHSIHTAIAKLRKALGDSADKLDQELPLDVSRNGTAFPSIHAAIELQRGNSLEAIRQRERAAQIELSEARDLPNLYPAYLRGLAYLQAGEPRRALVELRKLIEHPGTVRGFVIGALAHLQLARAYAMMGDKGAAHKSYQDFLTLWKDADPDIPVYRQAKAEYAKLNKLRVTSRQLPAKGSQLSAVRHQ